MSKRKEKKQLGEKKVKICILGASLDTKNMGVAALAASLVKIFHKIIPQSEIIFMIGIKSNKKQSIVVNGKEFAIPVVNCRTSPFSKLNEQILIILLFSIIYKIIPVRRIRELLLKNNKWLRTINEAEIIGEVRGGDSFSDIYGLKRYIVGIIPTLTVLLMKKELILLPQTYGPFNSKIAKVFAKYILSRSSKIMSRDLEGLTFVRNLLANVQCENKLSYCPDVAFTLEAKVPKAIQIRPEMAIKKERKVIGLNVNGLMYNGGYTRSNMFSLKMNYNRFIVKLVKRLLSETDCDIILVPHTFGKTGDVNSDPDACNDVMKKLTSNTINRLYVVDGYYDQNQIKGIIGLCDCFIGSRMHACIAAISQGIKTIAVAYSKKFTGVLKSVDLGEMIIDARKRETDDSVDDIMKIIKEEGHDKNAINKRMDEINKTIYGRIREVVS